MSFALLLLFGGGAATDFAIGPCGVDGYLPSTVSVRFPTRGIGFSSLSSLRSAVKLFTNGSSLLGTSTGDRASAFAICANVDHCRSISPRSILEI
jgi:hypothetical protein